jgi:SAM-dependent methyltransferase
MDAHSPQELQRIYVNRFNKTKAYRFQVWNVIVKYTLQKYIQKEDTVLDLGCGYGEFINNIEARKKYAIDLNPDTCNHLYKNITFIEQDCSKEWPLENDILNVIFTSNFFEHLPNKESLSKTLEQAYRCLKKDGLIIAMGPNIKYLDGQYWDFWDHYISLTDRSLVELLINRGFTIVKVHDKFLPYTMVGRRQFYPLFIKIYLRVKLFWKIFGKQFLVIAKK